MPTHINCLVVALQNDEMLYFLFIGLIYICAKPFSRIEIRWNPASSIDFHSLLVVDLCLTYFHSRPFFSLLTLIREKKFIMLLHNNSIANAAFLSAAESPSSTAGTFSHPHLQASTTNQFFGNFQTSSSPPPPPPWIDPYNAQRLFAEPYFVCIVALIVRCSSSTRPSRS